MKKKPTLKTAPYEDHLLKQLLDPVLAAEYLKVSLEDIMEAPEIPMLAMQHIGQAYGFFNCAKQSDGRSTTNTAQARRIRRAKRLLGWEKIWE